MPPVIMLLSEKQMSEDKGAQFIIDALHPANKDPQQENQL
jgi:hypothetical protein